MAGSAWIDNWYLQVPNLCCNLLCAVGKEWRALVDGVERYGCHLRQSAPELHNISERMEELQRVSSCSASPGPFNVPSQERFRTRRP